MEGSVSLLRPTLPPRVESKAVEGWYDIEDRFESFLWSRYDWSKFDPSEYGYQVIRLGVGGKYDFFAIVSLSDYKRLSKKKWKPRVEFVLDRFGEKTDTIKRVDACRTEKRDGKWVTVYMHREIIGAGEGLDAAHGNGCSLDNRRGNLKPTQRGPNNHEWMFRDKPVNSMLPRGVVWAGERTQAYVRASFWWTTRDGRRKQIRSKRQWPVAQASEAHKAYLKLKERHYRHRKFAAGGRALPMPKFPPPRRQLVHTAETDSLLATF